MPTFSRLLAHDRPDEAALIHGERIFGWADVDSILNRAAGLLLSADLGPSRRVAVFAENAPETALAHLAGLFAGVSTVPVSFHLTAAETAYILDGLRFPDPLRRARHRKARRGGGAPHRR